MKPVYLKYRDLVLVDACSQKEVFRDLFGEKVLATVTTAVAHANRFDWHWMANAFLIPEQLEKFCNGLAADKLPDCGCTLCDPHQVRTPRIAALFAKCYLAQGGTDYHYLAKRRRGVL